MGLTKRIGYSHQEKITHILWAGREKEETRICRNNGKVGREERQKTPREVTLDS